MAFQSQAQRKKFFELMRKGQISEKTFKEWEADTPKNIPERVAKPKKKMRVIK